ncbi:N-acetylglucosamine-6-phosphate deacetylase [Sphingomonas dokdonensis]|uniref:N-acetylglucosamine-6-phosphate deacetylase n=1 Tax=Sphingomonas dokdonensis TaxID=344880 RepID=A0A245ZNG4_9SPHN|nr:N-acetylglucosamine-6-phosphate deacetylase [Sphingomonas dokdonensis]OWK31280.1 N-acetylglucosamine-6-phosphate deacetylase [Sphingomonas dokdonensis]
MTATLLFRNGTVVLGNGRTSDHLHVAGDRVVARLDGAADRVIDLAGGWLLPGFVDTQVNGGGGVLFNDDPSVATIARIGAAHARFGTTAFLPTLISDTLDRVDMAMRATEQAIAAGVPGVVGIHIEGPFLNPARKGTHDETRFVRLNADAIRLLGSLKHGRTMVTLAPEMCSPADIRALVAAGVIVSAGHTDADYETMRAGFAAGITGVTHLYNAMSPLHHREPGVVGATLENQEVFAGLIVDGRHVAPAALRVALAARPHDRFMLVTDAMSTVGTDADHFVLQGKTIRIVGGVCVEEDGTLAGSALDMATAVRNAVTMTGVSVVEAAAMAATAPAAFLSLDDRGPLQPGARADLAWLDAALAPRGTWIGGVPLAAA